MSFDGGALSVSFTDWKEDNVRFVCADTLAFRWQRAEYYLSKEERFDSIYEVQSSDWLRSHRGARRETAGRKQPFGTSS